MSEQYIFTSSADLQGSESCRAGPHPEVGGYNRKTTQELSTSTAEKWGVIEQLHLQNCIDFSFDIYKIRNAHNQNQVDTISKC